MARLRKGPDESNESVGDSARRRVLAESTTSSTPRPTRRARPTPASTARSSEHESSDGAKRRVPKLKTTAKTAKTQIRLQSIQTLDSSLKSQVLAKEPRRRRSPEISNSRSISGDSLNSPHFKVKAKHEEALIGDKNHIEESIWCGSLDGSDRSSDERLPSLKKSWSSSTRANDGRLKLNPQADLTQQLKALSIFDEDLGLNDLQPPVRKIQQMPRPSSSSDKENEAIMRYSPPTLTIQRKQDPFERPATPPQLLSPAKSKLKSPSKRVPRIPTPPLRPSLDAFWTANAVNDWNDQYSPQKPLKSPRKLFFRAETENHSPTSSPRKVESPFKRTKAELEARRDFESRKMALAESFLAELDRRITKGQVQQLAASTGGVQLVWSKTLNSTAGRANWRRETVKSKHANGDTSTTHKHFASIELATKVIDDEHRLLNVIAHEFCHLANFMVSGVKDQPHGKQFKEWGRLCTRTFGERGVEVTTKHSYEIEYKYIWQCSSEECAMEFKRHSKSIDPSRHRCGSCKSNLVQIKPVPRKVPKQAESDSRTFALGSKEGDAKSAPVTGYAAYVKQHFAALKKSMPGSSHKEVMEALGRKYRANKAAGTIGTSKPDFSTLADAIAKTLERVKLDNSSDPVIIDSD